MRGLLKYLLLICWILLLCEAVSRLGLQLSGKKVGELTPYWTNFTSTDSLVELPQFHTNDLGLLVAHPDFEFGQVAPKGIGPEGFRGRRFDDTASCHKRILLIGDSYTWGSNAQPRDSCFANQLDGVPGNCVFNTGIPGSDPAQYAAIARTYIDRLRPDVLVICYYAGNDQMIRPREIMPGRPQYFQTNIGWIRASDGERFFGTVEEAHAHFRATYLLEKDGLLPFLGRNSGIFSLVSLVRQRVTEYREYKQALRSPVSADYLSEIRDLCLDRRVLFRLLFIPEYRSDLKEEGCDGNCLDAMRQKYRPIFAIEGVEPLIPSLTVEDYVPWPDGHFNNRGHSKAFKTLSEAI